MPTRSPVMLPTRVAPVPVSNKLEHAQKAHKYEGHVAQSAADVCMLTAARQHYVLGSALVFIERICLRMFAASLSMREPNLHESCTRIRETIECESYSYFGAHKKNHQLTTAVACYSLNQLPHSSLAPPRSSQSSTHQRACEEVLD